MMMMQRSCHGYLSNLKLIIKTVRCFKVEDLKQHFVILLVDLLVCVANCVSHGDEVHDPLADPASLPLLILLVTIRNIKTCKIQSRLSNISKIFGYKLKKKK